MRDTRMPPLPPVENGLLPLSLRGVSLVLGGVPALRDVTFDLGPQGCTAIMGPNGAGKSLLLRVLHGLLRPTGGHVLWNGRTPDQAMIRQALVFQKPVLLRRSVAANIDFVLKARGKDRSRCQALLAQVDLAHKATQPARLLSGGEAQRLALARALATEPEILLLDEPTASLDPASALMIERIVQDVQARGVRVIIVTHDAAQARRVADDVLFLHRGHVVEHTPASHFFDAPQSQAARAYLDGAIVV